MLRRTRTVRRIAREIADAADGAFESHRDGSVVEEPQVTDRILGAIQDRIRNRRFGDIVWNARTLRTGRGISAEEKRHGADLMGVLDINLYGYIVKKGFLAQAKRAEPYSVFDSRDWKRLRSQCERMLDRTPDSFVFVYSIWEGIRIFPANAVFELGSRHIFDLYDRGVASFFESHIQCFIGDRRLNSTSIDTLDALVELPVERVLELSARTSE